MDSPLNTAFRQQTGKAYHSLSVSLLTLLFAIACVMFTQLGATSIRMSKAEIERLGQKYGARAQRRLEAWQSLLDELKGKDERAKLVSVNNFFNQVRWLDDAKHWNKKDYWATPVEFLITNGGDCEDFSIAKYYTLKELGVAVDKMNLAYVKALEYNQAHMVLTYYSKPKSVPLVLDNINKNILPATKRPDLLHVYSFNGEKLWLSKTGRRTTLVGASSRLKPWVKLQSRIENNDINLR